MFREKHALGGSARVGARRKVAEEFGFTSSNPLALEKRSRRSPGDVRSMVTVISLPTPTDSDAHAKPLRACRQAVAYD